MVVRLRTTSLFLSLFFDIIFLQSHLSLRLLDWIATPMEGPAPHMKHMEKVLWWGMCWGLWSVLWNLTASMKWQSNASRLSMDTTHPQLHLFPGSQCIYQRHSRLTRLFRSQSSAMDQRMPTSVWNQRQTMEWLWWSYSLKTQDATNNIEWY